MSKTIKRILSTLLVVAAFATLEPANYINLLTEKAYASSSFDSSDNALLSSLDTDEGSFSFSSTKSTATGKVKSSVDEVKITAKAKDSSYEITIDGTDVTGEGSKTVDLNKGRNAFKIKVEDPSGKKSSVTYYAYITRGISSSSSDDDDGDDDVYLDDITISGESFSFSKTKNSYNIEVAESADEIRIKAEPEDDDDTVEIDGTTVDDDDNYKKTVSLDKGKNEIEVKVEDDDDNDRTYTLNVYRGVTASTTIEAGEIDNDQDSIYVDDINLVEADTNINFNKKVTTYNVNVKDDLDSLIVKVDPDDSDDDIRINEDTLGSNYDKRINLQKGKNVIKVKVYNDAGDDDDDYEERIYTINVNRGTATNNNTTANTTTSTTTNTAANNSAANTTAKTTNQWIKNNYGQWTYNDALGKPIINTWFFDKSYGKWYRLGFDGSMRTGWQYENGNTYYLNEDGSMQIGWKHLGNLWYYFNNNGSAKAGWLQDNDGKWYYFYPGGTMASDVRVSGYKLGSDGAMI